VRAEPHRDAAQGVAGLDDVGRPAGRGLGDGGDDDGGRERECGHGDEPEGPAPTVAGPARKQRHSISSVTDGVRVTTEEKVDQRDSTWGDVDAVPRRTRGMARWSPWTTSTRSSASG